MLRRSLQRTLLRHSPLPIATCLVMTLLISCASSTTAHYFLELSGVRDTSCEITHNQIPIGTFVVPSTVDLGGNVGTIEAQCRLHTRVVRANVRASEPKCQDQIVIKGPCVTTTTMSGTVDILVKRAR
jgi:hypothetical protein